MNNEGCVYETTHRGRRVYVAELQWTDEDGKEQRRSAQRTRQQDAKTWLDRARYDLVTKRTITKATEAHGPLFEEYAETWLARRKPELGANTYRQYEGNLRLYLTPKFGKKRLRASPADWSIVLPPFLGDESIGERTRQQCLATMRQIFADAVHDGAIVSVPFTTEGRRRLKVRVERREMHVLDAQQQRRFLAAASGDRLEALWVLALSSGMREGELLALRWAHVKGDQVEVQRSADARTRRTAQTKSRSSVRRIDLDATTIAALQAHRRRLHAAHEAYLRFMADRPKPRRKDRKSTEPPPAGSECRPHDLVFVNTVGKAISATNLSKREFKAVLAAANLPDIRFHDLRHSHATLLLSNGVNPKVVQERLGHESVRTTLDLYGHVLPSSQREAARNVGRLLWPKRDQVNPRPNPRPRLRSLSA